MNIILFVPLGVGLWLAGVRFRTAMLVSAAVTVTVETLQFSIIAGRDASFRDMLTNCLGAFAGYQAANAFARLARPGPRTARTFCVAAVAAWFAAQAFGAWALEWAPPTLPCSVNISPRYEWFPAAFAGTIVRLSIGDLVVLPGEEIQPAEQCMERLHSGAPLTVVTTTSHPSRGIAPLLIISGDSSRKVVALLAQDGRNAVLKVRVRAAVMRFRNPSVRLAAAFPPGPANDTITVSGAYTRGRYRLTAATKSRVVKRDLAASASWVWALILPFPSYAFGGEVYFLTGLWVFVAIGLITYWAAHAAERKHLVIRAVFTTFVVALGLAVIPVAFGIPVGHWSEWIAAMGGAVGGSALAGMVSAAEYHDLRGQRLEHR